ncbi:MAG TPA: flagellar basal-body MS-ring/collar protein FliF [Longimicrobiales bacterium]|jgi:flagellar M-ring protein FliF
MPPFIRNLTEKLGRGRTVAILLVGLGTLIAIWIFSRWATRPEWVPLFPGMPLELVGEVTDRLEKAEVAYRLAKGGTEVQVMDSDLARARVLLAKEGLPAKGRPGFELFDQPMWGMTDFTQRVNYRRALEGELARTIGQMRGVESAQVHLALQEATPFRRGERRGEASVFLKLRPGFRPSPELVEGITLLVASSVDGVTSEQVTVLDDEGRVLSAAVESGVVDAVTKRQLGLQREVESYLESKAQALVEDVVGPGNVRVRVSAKLNFDRVDRTVQAVDPEGQVVVREERSQVIPGPNSEGAGSLVESVSYETTRRIETVAGGVGGVERLTVAVLVNDRVVTEGGVTRTEPRTAAELQRIEALVRNAVGIDEGRGDAITVVSVPFDRRQPEVAVSDEGLDLLGLAERFQRPLVGVLGLVLAFVVGWRVLRSLRPAVVGEGPAVAAEVVGRLEGAAVQPELRLGSRELAAAAELAGGDRVSAVVAERPENAVRVIRAWIKDA